MIFPTFLCKIVKKSAEIDSLKIEESKAGKFIGISLLTHGIIFYKDLGERLQRETAKVGETTIGAIRDYFAGAEAPKVIPVAVGIVDRESLEKGKQD